MQNSLNNYLLFKIKNFICHFNKLANFLKDISYQKQEIS